MAIDPKAKAQSDKIVDQVNSLIVKQNGLIYDIGQRLSAIKTFQYYEVYGFNNWTDFTYSDVVKMGHSTMDRYVRLFERCKALGYNRDTATHLVEEFGVNRLEAALRGAEAKLSLRAIRARIEEVDTAVTQLGVSLSPKNKRKVIRALKDKGGLVVKDGRNMNLSDALLTALEVK